MRTVVVFSSATNTGPLIFIERGTVRFAVISPPRSDISTGFVLFNVSRIFIIALFYATQ